MSDKGILRGIATRNAKRAPMVEHDAIEILSDAGLVGDFGRKPGKAQVTIVAAEKWDAACAELNIVLPWTARRGNLFVSGISIEPIAGQHLTIGEVMLEITSETDPCHWMDAAHQGLRNALTPDARGGVRCRVIRGGWVRIGDAVAAVDVPT